MSRIRASRAGIPEQAIAERLRRARRILVVGPSGSGKTRLALRLGSLLDLPVVHLDAHRWQPGWVALPHREWRKVVGDLVQRPAWIMDGTYESTLDLRLAASDAVVAIEAPRLLCVYGVVRRRVLGLGRKRPDAPPGQPLDRAFLRYIWDYPVATRPLLWACLRERRTATALVVLSSRADVRRLVRELESVCGSAYAGRKRRIR